MPGWQKFKPLYRYGTIINDSIDYEADTCDICLEPEYSSQQNLPVNQGIEATDCKDVYYPQMADFCSRHPTHPTCTNTQPASPMFISDFQLSSIIQTQQKVNSEHEYASDKSGLRGGDQWDILGTGQAGDCEDFAFTKMQELIDKGYPVKNLQIAVVAVEGTTVENHAVLMIQTANRGTLILDNRYDEVKEKATLPYRFLHYQYAGQSFKYFATKLVAVPIVYQYCNAAPFADGDKVVIKFEGQNWASPKVVGFQYNPKGCGYDYWFFFGYADNFWNGELAPDMEIASLPNNYRYNSTADTWIEKARVHHTDPSWDYPSSLGYWTREDPGYTANDNDNYWVFGGTKPGRTTFPPFSFMQPYPYLTEHQVVNNSHRYSKMGDDWVDRTDLPNEARSSMAGYFINEKSYLIGGSEWLHDNIEPLCEVYNRHDCFDDLTNTWSAKLAYQISRMAYWTINNKAYFFGGNPVNLNSWEEYNPDNFVGNTKEYDPVTNTFLAKTGNTPWAGMTSWKIGDNGYLTGGRNIFHWSSEVEQYKPITDAWASKTNRPVNENGRRPAIGRGNTAYVWTRDDFTPGNWNQHQMYKQESDTWQIVGEIPQRSIGNGSGVSL